MLKQLASTKNTVFRSFLSQQNSLIAAAATTQFTKRAFSTTQSLESVLYIGNVSWSATEQDLSELTSKYGEATIRLPRDQMGRVRGFAFAEFAEDDAAQKAIADLDGTNFLGRDLKVSIAQGGTGGGGGFSTS
ncbi:4123_t:CDS:2 [Ambispora gerdemannii]|uniref:4123_t:CDS:1 n=1 Tax=Ambispora gerdemannii TaxID=144530 RepID=A0A9N8Z415_9GLOM|nr:4123_t:CDS:2 [Ambispora gerdemannii]